LLSFTYVYFFESRFFNGLQAIQTKNSSGLFLISHVLNGNGSRAGVGRTQSGDSKFIARIADFSSMSELIFDLATQTQSPLSRFSKRCINRFGGVSALRRI
jgi:hypothetical protein